jgi:hypothetical protein
LFGSWEMRATRDPCVKQEGCTCIGMMGTRSAKRLGTTRWFRFTQTAYERTATPSPVLARRCGVPEEQFGTRCDSVTCVLPPPKKHRELDCPCQGATSGARTSSLQTDARRWPEYLTRGRRRPCGKARTDTLT